MIVLFEAEMYQVILRYPREVWKTINKTSKYLITHTWSTSCTQITRDTPDGQSATRHENTHWETHVLVGTSNLLSIGIKTCVETQTLLTDSQLGLWLKMARPVIPGNEDDFTMHRLASIPVEGHNIQREGTWWGRCHGSAIEWQANLVHTATHSSSQILPNYGWNKIL